MSNLRKLLAIAAVFALSCGGGASETKDVKKPIEDVKKPDGPGDQSQIDPGPDAEQVLTWVLDKLKSGGALSEDEAKSWFAPSFLKMVPYPKLAETFKALAVQLPPVKVLKKSGEAPRELKVLLDTKAGGIRMLIGLNNEVPRQIEALAFQPAATEAPPKTYGDAVKVLKEAGSEVMYSVSEIKKGQCTPVQNFQATKSLAIGSSFKLWVLAALDRKIKRSQKVTWDGKLPIEDALKSLPTGVLQDQKAGTQLTLREYATKMISISDNTATDHLINFIGRKEVEKMLGRAKHSKAKANVPFLMTREMFALKLASTDAEIDSYRRASVKKKRKLLDEMRKKEIKLEMATNWQLPKALDLEWFADGRDLCNVMNTIGTMAKWKTDSEVMKVLAVNPGVGYDKKQWKYLGFKGGAEPGVINLTFLGQRNDDRWFVATMTVNDKDKAVSDAVVINVAVGTLAILGAEK